MAKELTITGRKPRKSEITLKTARGIERVEIENFNPIAFARALSERIEKRGGTSKQQLVAKVEADLRRRGIRV